MATVGELVEACVERLPTPHTTFGQTFDALRSLGLWDAEVLELRRGFDDCGRRCYHDDNCNEWLVESDAECVRVIVLKEEK